MRTASACCAHRRCVEVLLRGFAFRVAQNSGAMAGALVRKARTYLASAVVRAWTPVVRQRLVGDRPDFEVARRFSSSSSSSSSSSLAGHYREGLLGNITRLSTSHACPQLLRKESIASLLPHSVRGFASQSAPRLQRQRVQEEVRKQHRIPVFFRL